MKKSVSYIILLGIISIISVSGCQKKPEALFTTTEDVLYVNEEIEFINTSINGQTFEWDFGDGSTSKLKEPKHTYRKGGTYNVTLTAFSENGNKTDERTVSIEVENTLTFKNTTFTYIYVTIGTEEKIVHPGQSLTLYEIEDGAIYQAYTVGKTLSGTEIGLTISWNGIVNYTNQNTHTFEVSVGYFFLTVINSTYNPYPLTDIYINYGLSDEEYVDITIPNNGIKYVLGYYHANINSNISYYNGYSYNLWDFSYYLNSSSNQSVSLYF